MEFGKVEEVNMNRLLKASRLLRKLTGKLRNRFATREISRRQLNITIDNKLILGLKFAARDLEVPIYVVAEHCLQLGLQEVYLERHDKAFKANLQQHLQRNHLLVPSIDPIDERLGVRVRRLRNAMRFLRFFEVSTDVKRQQELLIKLIHELAGGGKQNDNRTQ